MEAAHAMGSPVVPDTWKNDLATLLARETVYPYSVWNDALSVVEAWEDRDEAAKTIVSVHNWLYPPSFARLLASWRPRG